MVTVVVAGWAEWITKKQPSSLCERRKAVGFREGLGGFLWWRVMERGSVGLEVEPWGWAEGGRDLWDELREKEFPNRVF